MSACALDDGAAPRPWRAAPHGVIVDNRHRQVLVMLCADTAGDGESSHSVLEIRDANTALVVRVVNAHEALVRATEEASDALALILDACRPLLSVTESRAVRGFGEVVQQAREALALARTDVPPQHNPRGAST